VQFSPLKRLLLCCIPTPADYAFQYACSFNIFTKLKRKAVTSELKNVKARNKKKNDK